MSRRHPTQTDIDSDLFLNAARGKLVGVSTVLIRGHNPSQTAASGFVDITEFGSVTYLSSAETMEIASTSTADDGDPVGTGLQTLLIQGVDNTGAAIQETVTLNGTTDVQTQLSYLRVNNMVGLAAGSGNTNAGAITATATTASTIQDKIGIANGISHSGLYTVPLGHTLYVSQAEFNVAKLSGGQAPVVEFSALARSGGAGNCFVQLFDKRADAAVTDEIDVFVTTYGPAIARTDIRVQADTDQDDTETRCRIYGLLISDDR